MEKNFYLINVPGKYGYSFMVRTEMDDEQDILDAALNLELFDSEEDYEYANVSETDDHDREFFDEFYDIDED